MTEIEKVQQYIKKYAAPSNLRYDASLKEIIAIAHGMTPVEAVHLAFIYGRAKGYRAAKAERRASV